MAHTEWTLVAADGSGNALAELTRAAGTSLTFTRNGVPECQFSLSHDDDECATILNAMAAGTGGGMPTLKAYREGRDGAKTLRFNGYLAAISEESGADNSTATFTFRGPFGLVLGGGDAPGRFVPASGIRYNGVDAGQIATHLLGQGTSGPTRINILPSSAEDTVFRDRTYIGGTNIGEAIINLTNVLDGFDFEVVPSEGALDSWGWPAYGTIYIYAKQGTDQPSARFEYGQQTLANCASLHRQTQMPRNYIVATGSNNLLSTKTDAASISKYGRLEVHPQFTDVSEQATLDEKAYALLRPNPIKTIDFTPDPRLAPSPWDDYWIGDTVYFYAGRGALQEGPVPVRVNQITVAIDPDTGLEAATIPDPVSPEEERIIRASIQTEVVE